MPRITILSIKRYTLSSSCKKHHSIYRVFKYNSNVKTGKDILIGHFENHKRIIFRLGRSPDGQDRLPEVCGNLPFQKPRERMPRITILFNKTTKYPLVSPNKDIL